MGDAGHKEPAQPSQAAAPDVDVEQIPGGPGAADVYDEAFSTNRVYAPSPKHRARPRVVAGRTIQKAPTNGQSALDVSVSISPHTQRRVGVDIDAQEFVVFDRTGNQVEDRRVVGGVYHGHVRNWEDLEPEMQAALERNGIVDDRGRITIDSTKWDTTP